MKNKTKWANFLIVVVGCFLAFGCASTIPISDDTIEDIPISDGIVEKTPVSDSTIEDIPISDGIIEDIGGIGNADQFQYYISKTITLTLVDTRTLANIEGGQLIRTSTTARDTVVIQVNLPGLVQGQGESINSNLNPILLVAFEEYDGSFPTLSFGKYRVGSQERYYLLYHDPDNNIVQYGDNRYIVSFDRSQPHEWEPYLLIKASKSEISTSTSRRAGGLRLQN